MTLVQSWVDSLTLLKPKNFQLFVMVTIKAIIQAYKILLYYFWWVMLLIALCAAAPYVIQPQQYMFYNVQYKHLFYFTSCLLYELLFLATCFSTRPSILQKDCAYFRLQFQRIALFWLIVPFLAMIHDQLWSSSAYYVYIFTVLFFADSEGGPKSFLLSIWNAIKMIIYNQPLILVIGLVTYLPVLIGGKYLPQLLVERGMPVYPQFFLIFNVIGALLLPIGVCIYTNIYIKRLHDQFDFYFSKSQ